MRDVQIVCKHIFVLFNILWCVFPYLIEGVQRNGIHHVLDDDSENRIRSSLRFTSLSLNSLTLCSLQRRLSIRVL